MYLNFTPSINEAVVHIHPSETKKMIDGSTWEPVFAGGKLIRYCRYYYQNEYGWPFTFKLEPLTGSEEKHSIDKPDWTIVVVNFIVLGISCLFSGFLIERLQDSFFVNGVPGVAAKETGKPPEDPNEPKP